MSKKSMNVAKEINNELLQIAEDKAEKEAEVKKELRGWADISTRDWHEAEIEAMDGMKPYCLCGRELCPEIGETFGICQICQSEEMEKLYQEHRHEDLENTWEL